MRHANHEANALAVANRQIDMATNNNGTLHFIQTRHTEKFKEIKVIWTSPLIPSDPLVIRKDVPPNVATKIKDFFYTYGATDENEKQVLIKLGDIRSFAESSDKQLTPIRQLDLYSQRIKIEQNTALGSAEKTAALTDIQKKLKALE